MTWHPQVLRDPALSGEPFWTCSVDPGRPTGLAILHCSAEGEVHAASSTLRLGKHPTPSGVVSKAVREAIFARLNFSPMFGAHAPSCGGDLREHWWEYAGEDMGAVHVRAGTDHAQAQGKRLSLQRVARLEGQIAESVSQAVALRGEAVYEAREWRKLLDAASESSHTAKGLAMGFCHRHFGADWRAPEGTGDEQSAVWTVEHFSHEAEAILIGLHHIRQVRQGERRAQSPLPNIAEGVKKRTRRAAAPQRHPNPPNAPPTQQEPTTAAGGARAREACEACGKQGRKACPVPGGTLRSCGEWEAMQSD